MIHSFWQRRRLALATWAVFGLIITALTVYDRGWEQLGVPHLKPYFADLVAILAAGEARQAGLNVYQINPFDPFGRPHVYGPWWLYTGDLGLLVSDAWWLGTLLAIVFVGLAVALMDPRTPRAAIYVGLFLLSPPVLLGIERANNDLIMVVLLVIAVLLFRNGSKRGLGFGAAILIFAAGLKIYPIAAFAAIGAHIARWRLRWLILATSVTIFGLLWWGQRSDFSRALAIAPRPFTIFSYGLTMLKPSWVIFVEFRGWLIAGYVLGLLLAWAVLWPVRKEAWRSMSEHGLPTLALIAGASCWLFCYALNSNYAYRTVLFVLILPCWLRLAASTEDPRLRAFGVRACRFTLGALWLALPKFWASQAVETRSFDVDIVTPFLIGVVGLDQVLWLAMSLLVAVCLAGWAWRFLPWRLPFGAGVRLPPERQGAGKIVPSGRAP